MEDALEKQGDEDDHGADDGDDPCWTELQGQLWLISSASHLKLPIPCFFGLS